VSPRCGALAKGWLTTMNAHVMALSRMARQAGPVSAAVAAAALSMGAYSSDAHVARRAASRATLSLVLRPRAVTLTPGSSVRLTVVIRRHGISGPVRLAVTSKLPRGLTVRFAPPRPRGRHSVLTLRATLRLRAGRYVLVLRAVGGHVRRKTKLVLNVPAPSPTSPPKPGGSLSAGGQGSSSTADAGAAFSITGSAAEVLEPGATQPIDLQIENPNSDSLTLSTLTTVVSGVEAPRATPALPCTTSDFAVQQYAGMLPLVIAPNSTLTLQQLGVPQSEWPQVSMLDWATNQDGCQAASLRLSYGATASLG
jgi:hypothetical protein